MNMKKSRVKGFTLIELIVVIAIIGILLAILAPTMSAYFRRSRLKTANADAKLVYNAAQTYAQNFMAIDRTRAAGDESLMKETVLVSYNAETHSAMYGTVYGAINKAIASETDPQIKADMEGFVEYVNKTVSEGDRKNWCVAVEGYMVKGSISGNSQSTNIVGFYSSNHAQATEASNQVYSAWLSGAIADGSLNTIFEVTKEYDK